jgi:hypothetical protein
MNTIEEQLWEYIDGNCTPEEQLKIEAKLAVNLQYHQIYQELLKVNEELNKIDFEEPSMSFARNVMEQVALELKPVALKTKIDNRIIYSIGSLFFLSIVGVFGYAIANSDFSFTLQMPKINFGLSVSKMITPFSLQIFIMVDVVLALLYLDSFLRKRKNSKA